MQSVVLIETPPRTPAIRGRARGSERRSSGRVGNVTRRILRARARKCNNKRRSSQTNIRRPCNYLHRRARLTSRHVRFAHHAGHIPNVISAPPSPTAARRNSLECAPQATLQQRIIEIRLAAGPGEHATRCTTTPPKRRSALHTLSAPRETSQANSTFRPAAPDLGVTRSCGPPP